MANEDSETRKTSSDQKNHAGLQLDASYLQCLDGMYALYIVLLQTDRALEGDWHVFQTYLAHLLVYRNMHRSYKKLTLKIETGQMSGKDCELPANPRLKKIRMGRLRLFCFAVKGKGDH